MRRRDLLLSIGGSAVLCPLGSADAQPRKPVVGILRIGSPDSTVAGRYDPLIEELRKLGYEDGKSVVIENRWAHGDITRYPKLAQELIERSPAVIVAPCGPSLRAIRDISRTVPVIAICADERNFLGEVASRSRPSGYTTGVTFLAPESVGKRLEFLKEMVPGLSRVAVLYEPSDPIDAHWRELERLQPLLGLSYQRLPVARAEELESAFDALARERAQALFVFPTNRMIAEAARIAELARKHRVASAFEFPLHADAGGLLSYGGSVNEWWGKLVPLYVDKILKGAKPAELPIIEPTQFELVVNLRTAHALGLEIPQSVLHRADRVIE
jgi:putative ABC transport system substrate-binding protein